MWALYDDLIEGIPGEYTVDRLICGAQQTLVVSGGGYGISGTFDDTWRGVTLPTKRVGMPLRDLAACIKSWNFTEASIGLAALNAYYNEKEILRSLGIPIADTMHVEDRLQDPFIAYQNDIRGKTVTVVGRFPYLEQLFAPVCNLRVIEKYYPQVGDYPEQAADYLLPESDFVFLSSYTIVEKQLPRFLQLSACAHVTLVGPATTMAPILASYGVVDLSGFVIKDIVGAEHVALGYGRDNYHSLGQKISLRLDRNGLKTKGGK